MNKPLMGGVLVDQHEAAIGGDGDDVGVEHLRDRRAEGEGDVRDRGGLGGERPVEAVRRREHPRGGRTERQPRLSHPARLTCRHRMRARHQPQRRAGLHQMGAEHQRRRRPGTGGQGAPEPADDQRPHSVGVAKAHLGLGGMHVHVHLVGRQIEEHGDDGVAAMGDHVAIGDPHGGAQQRVGDRAAIDDQRLQRRGGAAHHRRARETGEVQVAAHGVHRQQGGGGLGAEQCCDAGLAGLGRKIEGHAAVALEAEGGGGGREGEPADGDFGGVGLAAGGFEEFASRGGGVEQVAHDHPRARGARRRGDGADDPALDGDGDGVLGVRRAAGDRQPGGGADRGQRLAAEAEGGNADQLVVGQFRGRVALDGEGQLVAGHAGAVIGDLDARDAAAGDGDADAPRARIERVLHQLARRGGRPLDHLAGGDPVDRRLGEHSDAACPLAWRRHHASPRNARKRAISDAVDGSCAPNAAPGCRSGRMSRASTLPSSTPH